MVMIMTVVLRFFVRVPGDFCVTGVSIYQYQILYYYLAVKRLLARSLAPKMYRAKMPKMQPAVRPPSRETPRATPRLMNKGRAKRMAPAARADRRKSLPAKSEAA